MGLGISILVNRIFSLIYVIIIILVVAWSLKWVLESVDIHYGHTHCSGETVKK